MILSLLATNDIRGNIIPQILDNYMKKSAKKGKIISPLIKEKYKKFDYIYTKIKSKRRLLKKESRKKIFISMLRLGYQLLLLDTDADRSVLSEYLAEKGYGEIKGNRNPYLPIVKACFKDSVLNKNNKTRYGQILYYAVQKNWKTDAFNEKKLNNLRKFAEKGAKLICVDYPAANNERAYNAGEEFLKSVPTLGNATIKARGSGGRIIALIGWLDEDCESVEIKHVINSKERTAIIKRIGKVRLKKES